jgi:hypothetical protein
MRWAVSIALVMVIAVMVRLNDATAVAASAAVQEDPAGEARRKTFDEFLDLYVRDGYVYYRALKSERSRFDAYVNSLAEVQVGALSRDEQLAFWLNAYNSLVLRTVIDHYPIQGHSPEYPPRSIRQIPGAFERLTHRVAGRTLTLDQIEQTVLPTFHDPRAYLALGRGSVGGGRLRSEAFSPARLEAQLIEVANECAGRAECIQIDRQNNRVLVSSIFPGAHRSSPPTAGRRPRPSRTRRSERAVLTLVEPKLLTTEREFPEKNQFQVSYKPFDWLLNDLTGRGGR